MRYPIHLIKLIEHLKKLPGVGNKSAERFAFDLLSWSSFELKNFANHLLELKDKLKDCPTCGCLIGEDNCGFCDANKRDTQTLCIVSSTRDAFAVESTHQYKGLYHVLGGLLSPLENRGPDKLRVNNLFQRLQNQTIQEVIMALDSTLEGDATALYLKKELNKFPVKISRLAFGIPMGSSFDYIDGGTLARAFIGRSIV